MRTRSTRICSRSSHPERAAALAADGSAHRSRREGVDCVVRVGALEDSGLVARRVGAMAPCTCATPAYLQRYGVPETLDALDGHVGVHYTSMNTGKARVWCFIDDGEPKTVAMKGAVSVNDADAYVAAVLAGLGLGKTSRYLVEPHPRTGALRRVPSRFDEPARPVSILPSAESQPAAQGARVHRMAECAVRAARRAAAARRLSGAAGRRHAARDRPCPPCVPNRPARSDIPYPARQVPTVRAATGASTRHDRPACTPAFDPRRSRACATPGASRPGGARPPLGQRGGRRRFGRAIRDMRYASRHSR
ncbi:LysR substrate-binding domain-containing protein [Burkholderia pseudomallei]|uniref:LysR substrate-binding domain-containing protein n=1 Tax=Burkholderia pseudomallei TaxID=28450 RepID=UPI000A85D93E|nr:LysR substrate-binding domain-containing protein [Burkholderia pseudomallei]